MPKPCSLDLRERVLETVEAGASRREAAERFEVSASSAIKWLQRWHETGSITVSAEAWRLGFGHSRRASGGFFASSETFAQCYWSVVPHTKGHCSADKRPFRKDDRACRCADHTADRVAAFAHVLDRLRFRNGLQTITLDKRRVIICSPACVRAVCAPGKA
jgi:hypothetical protein